LSSLRSQPAGSLPWLSSKELKPVLFAPFTGGPVPLTAVVEDEDGSVKVCDREGAGLAPADVRFWADARVEWVPAILVDEFGPGRAPGPPLAVVRFVERLIMSFPCTTRLSFDFFRSRVSISVTCVSWRQANGLHS
jgi:hypothetical protein